MNDQTPPQPDASQTEQQQGKKGLLFEILFVIIFLILIFNVLNYFNILRLSAIFPNYLGFLPHKPYQQSQGKQINSPRQSFPTFFPSSPSEQAKQTLVNFLPTILDWTLLATSTSNITFTKEKGVEEGFTAVWNTRENETVKVVFLPSPSNNSINSLIIVFGKTNSPSPSLDLAKTITAQLILIKPKGQWGCKEISERKILYCENFWEEENGVKMGIGLQGYPPLSKSKRSVIFFCEHSQASKLYSWKSCAPEFAKTGVR